MRLLAQARQLPPQLCSLIVTRCETRSVAIIEGVLHELNWNTLRSLCRPFWRIREFKELWLASELDLEYENWRNHQAQNDDSSDDEEEESGDIKDMDDQKKELLRSKSQRTLSEIYPTIAPGVAHLCYSPRDAPLSDIESEDGTNDWEADDDDEAGFGGSGDDGRDGESDIENSGETDYDDDGSDQYSEADEEESDGDDRSDAEAESTELAPLYNRWMQPTANPYEDADPRTIRRFAFVE